MSDIDPSRGFVRDHRSAEPLPGAGGHLLLGGGETREHVSVVYSETPAGDFVPPHVHLDADECFFVLDGFYSVTCGRDTFEAGPESLVYLPRGVSHSFEVGDEGGRTLILGVPSGLENFFRDMGDGMDYDELQARHRITFC